MVPTKDPLLKVPLSLSSKNPALAAPLFAVNSPTKDSGLPLPSSPANQKHRVP